MIEIAALTEHERTPSSRFRIRQYIDPLLKYNIKLEDYKREFSRQLASDGFQSIKTSPKRLAKATYYDLLNIYQTCQRINYCNKHDLIWLSRQLVINLPYLESFLKKPIIYDLDDAVYLESPLSRIQVNYCAKKADLIFAGNEFLAEYLYKFNNNVHIIPTSVDTDIFKPKKKKENNITKNNQVVIGWSGSSSSFKFFLPIEEVLSKIIHTFNNVKVIFVADRKPYELKLIGKFINFIKWSPKNEVSSIENFDIGLMPLNDSDWSKGKCAYKLLLYSALGIPVVVSPYGENAKILREANLGFGPYSPEEWFTSLDILIKDVNLRNEFGFAGRKFVENKYSLKEWSKIISELIVKLK